MSQPPEIDNYADMAVARCTDCGYVWEDVGTMQLDLAWPMTHQEMALLVAKGVMHVTLQRGITIVGCHGRLRYTYE